MKTWCLGYKCSLQNIEKVKRDLTSKISTILGCKLAYGESDSSDSTPMLYLGSGKSVLCTLDRSSSFLAVDINASSDQAENHQEKFESEMQALPWVTADASNAYKSLPAIRRNTEVKTYDVAAGGQIIEYDFTEELFNRQSPYQNVRIMKSNQFGNCLFLDNDCNLSESDLSYTVAICGDGKVDYTGKDVLVLGGGDGGILNYLMDKGPKMVTMVDIDQVVIDAAKIHLRGICGESLDSLKGENYEVIVDDCIKWMKKFAEEGRMFDVIINDLTAIPVSTSPVGDHWEFLKLILRMSMNILKKDGVYFTQGNSALCPSSLQMYEEQLEKLQCPVGYTKKNVCVPSYIEMWVFYTIWKKQEDML